jgi:hypothetical protein
MEPRRPKSKRDENDKPVQVVSSPLIARDFIMREIIRELCFGCSTCQHQTWATVHCAGKGIKLWPRANAAAYIRCPSCGAANRIIFSVGSGEVLDVAPAELHECAPIPSIN